MVLFKCQTTVKVEETVVVLDPLGRETGPKDGSQRDEGEYSTV